MQNKEGSMFCFPEVTQARHMLGQKTSRLKCLTSLNIVRETAQETGHFSIAWPLSRDNTTSRMDKETPPCENFLHKNVATHSALVESSRSSPFRPWISQTCSHVLGAGDERCDLPWAWTGELLLPRNPSGKARGWKTQTKRRTAE